MSMRTIVSWTRLFNACGHLLGRLIWCIVAVIILAILGRYVVSKDPGTTPESGAEPRQGMVSKAAIQAPVAWSDINQSIVDALAAARTHAEDIATARLDDWIASMMQRVDDDFLEWYFSYWNQQVLGLKGLWHWTLDTVFEAEGSAAEKMTAEMQTELSKRVLRPPIAQLELERITREVVNGYVQELTRNLEAIPKRYAIPQATWHRHIEDLAVITTNVEGNRDVSLSLKALTVTGTGGALVLAKQLQLIGGKLGSKVAAKFAGKTAAKVAAKSGSKVAAAVGGKLLGPIIGFGIIIWDVWDHYETKVTNKPLLRATIIDYFAEIKESLLHDPEAGVMAVIHTVERNVLTSLHTARR